MAGVIERGRPTTNNINNGTTSSRDPRGEDFSEKYGIGLNDMNISETSNQTTKIKIPIGLRTLPLLVMGKR